MHTADVQLHPKEAWFLHLGFFSFPRSVRSLRCGGLSSCYEAMNICCKFLLFKQSEIAPGVTMIFLSVWAWHYVLQLSSKDLDCLVPGRLHDRILQNDTRYLTWI